MPQYYECDCSSPAIVALSSVLFVFVRRPAVQWRSTASVTYIPLYTSSIVTIETTNIPIQQKKDYFIPSFLFIIHIELIQWNTWSIFALNVCIFSKSFQYIIIMIKFTVRFEVSSNWTILFIELRIYIYIYIYCRLISCWMKQTHLNRIGILHRLRTFVLWSKCVCVWEKYLNGEKSVVETEPNQFRRKNWFLCCLRFFFFGCSFVCTPHLSLIANARACVYIFAEGHFLPNHAINHLVTKSNNNNRNKNITSRTRYKKNY